MGQLRQTSTTTLESSFHQQFFFYDHARAAAVPRPWQANEEEGGVAEDLN